MDPLSSLNPASGRISSETSAPTPLPLKAATSPPNATGPPPAMTLDEAIKTLALGLDVLQVGLRRDVDPDTQALKITLYDKRSGEVIRTIPQESIFETARHWQQAGSLFSTLG